MMAPVFSRAAWRCSWYMIQVTFLTIRFFFPRVKKIGLFVRFGYFVFYVWVLFGSAYFVQHNFMVFNGFVFDAERFDPCLGSGCAAWLLCSSWFLFLNLLFRFLNQSRFRCSCFKIFLVADRVIGRKM